MRYVSALAGAAVQRAAVGPVGAGVSAVFDRGCLACSILAVSGHVPWQGLLVAYGMGQLVANLPITPDGIGIVEARGIGVVEAGGIGIVEARGIGVVEGTMSVLLVAYGMHSSTALAAVLLYRIISSWSLVPVGWILVGVLAHRRGAAAAVTAPAARGSLSTPPATVTG